MVKKAKWNGPAVALGVTLVAAACVFVALRSRAVLDARHTLPPSAVIAATKPAQIAQGHELTLVTACGVCHGANLAGSLLSLSGSAVYAPNLTIVSHRLSDADLDRAIRRGLRPDGASELLMPSHAYAAFTDDEVAAIIGYLRSLKPQGAVPARPSPGPLLRANIAAGLFKVEAQRLADAKPPLDAGPAFAPGRHLAQVACGQCHGTDLGGGGGPGPDLTVLGYYDRAQFHTLMRTGESIDDDDMVLMSRTARMNFSHFSDSQIDAIFDYLQARDRLLGAKGGHAPGG